MSNPIVPVTAAVLLAVAPGAASAPVAAAPGYQVAQLVIQQQLVVRMRRPAMTPTVWVEKKGPKCVRLDDLAGALVLQPEAVDLVLAGGDRVRARLDDHCPSLNFYKGFYLKPTKDGKLCAGRDAIRSRTGRMCDIDSFKKLVAKR